MSRVCRDDARTGDICPSIGHLPSAHALARGVRTDTAKRGAVVTSTTEEANRMLWTIFVILLVLWAIGMVSSYTLGGFIHLLLLVAIAVVLIRIIQGRRPV